MFSTLLDLNQSPYDYTVEVRNRFKGLDLIDREPDELWTEVCDIVQETGIKTISTEKKWKKENAEALILWPPGVKNWLIEKDPDAGKEWRQEEQGTTEDEMVG